MRFAYIADVPWWAIARHGQGLVDHHRTEHSWELFYVSEDSGERHIRNQDLDIFDAVVYGGLSIWWMSRESGWVPSSGNVIAVTMASFRDARGMSVSNVETGEEVDLSYCLEDLRVRAIVINDRRMAPHVMRYELPVIHHPDRVDLEVFRPMPELWPSSGPLRIGWAGSDAHWKSVKHLEEIVDAVKRNPCADLVLQRREVEGLKSPEEMCRWYNGLDLYVCANDELTPTPVPILEAVACSTPVLTTRCGELWVALQAADSESVEDSPAVVARSLKRTRNREYLEGVRGDMPVVARAFSWQYSGEGELFTRTMEELCRH